MRAAAYRLQFPVVQTAIIEMYNPWSRSTITLFGLLHQADADYFRQMEAQVNRLTGRGITVLQENFTVDQSSFSEEVLKQWYEVLAMPELQNGQSGQMHHFLPANTEPCDLALSGDTRKTRKVMQVILDAANDTEHKKTRARKVFDALVLQWLAGPMEFLSVTYRFLIGDRNRYVLGVVAERQAAKPQDMGIVFGAAHINGIMRGLRRMGYQQRQIRWLTAHTL